MPVGGHAMCRTNLVARLRRVWGSDGRTGLNVGTNGMWLLDVARVELGGTFRPVCDLNHTIQGPTGKQPELDSGGIR
jgi:hypothetical protein